MMIKNIVFDLGGVLIDWNPEYVFKSVFPDKAEMDFFLREICSPEWNAQQDAGRPFAEATAHLQEKFPKYGHEIALYYKNWTSMLGGAIEENVKLLDVLNEKYRLFALTNWAAESFPIAQKLFPFLGDFEGVVVSGEEKLIKPDERIYQVLLQRYNLVAKECLFIDDSLKNVKAANTLGFKTIHFSGESKLMEQLKQLQIM